MSNQPQQQSGSLDPKDTLIPHCLGIDCLRQDSNNLTDWDKCALKKALDTGGFVNLLMLGMERRDDLASIKWEDPSSTSQRPVFTCLPAHTVSQTLCVVSF